MQLVVQERSHSWAQVDVRQKREELIREEVELHSQAQWDLSLIHI